MLNDNEVDDLVGGSIHQHFGELQTQSEFLESPAPDEFAMEELGVFGILVDGELMPERAPEEVTLYAQDWRACDAILKLREQINELYPDRDRSSDGTIGDRRHASRRSDHNPWIVENGVGVVTAIDITNDLDAGCNCENIAENLRASRDERIKYLIWNRKIFNSREINGSSAWEWRGYGGSNPHVVHFHISVNSQTEFYDNASDWDIFV